MNDESIEYRGRVDRHALGVMQRYADDKAEDEQEQVIHLDALSTSIKPEHLPKVWLSLIDSNRACRHQAGSVGKEPFHNCKRRNNRPLLV
jgi:hypothetical protein